MEAKKLLIYWPPIWRHIDRMTSNIYLINQTWRCGVTVVDRRRRSAWYTPSILGSSQVIQYSLLKSRVTTHFHKTVSYLWLIFVLFCCFIMIVLDIFQCMNRINYKQHFFVIDIKWVIMQVFNLSFRPISYCNYFIMCRFRIDNQFNNLSR